MPKTTKIQRALLSVSDKTGIVDFARALHEMGVDIISTGGTARALKEAGVPVMGISEYTGSPEILGGRVKTLHPKVHGGILGVRNDPEHRREMESAGIGPIDLVVVNLYPFEETSAREGSAFGDAVEDIDIGGPAMLRAAAKNHGDVAAVVDPADYETIAEELGASGCALSWETRFRLAKKAFAATARYDLAISTYFGGCGKTEKDPSLPAQFGFICDKVCDLRYGENPHQKAAFYRESARGDIAGIAGARQLHGKGLSYNNIMDADAAMKIVAEFSGAPFACAIVKHANPCGVAVSLRSLAEAFEKSRGCDPASAFGGIVGLSRSVDEKCAGAIAETFFEVVVASSFDDSALSILKGKKNLRLIEAAEMGRGVRAAGYDLRKVAGGLLVQEMDSAMEDVRRSRVVTRRAPTDEEWRALDFAWRVCKHVKSNAIVYAARDRTLGIGAGQMSRIDSSKIAAMKVSESKGTGGRTTHDARRTTIAVASDAFFPFRDGIDAAAETGATAVIQPGGSIRDEEVIAAADGHGMAMAFTGIRHLRH